MPGEPDEWDPQLEELGSELRQRVGSEFRREAEEIEALTEKQRLRKRSLSDAAGELMSRGDQVSVVLGDHRFSGRISATQGSLLQLMTEEAAVDVNLDAPVALQSVERARAGGLSPTGGAASFKARLAEYEQTGEALELIVAPLGDVVYGRVDVVGTDHAMVVDDEGREWYLPLGTIAMVVQRPLSRS